MQVTRVSNKGQIHFLPTLLGTPAHSCSKWMKWCRYRTRASDVQSSHSNLRMGKDVITVTVVGLVPDKLVWVLVYFWNCGVINTGVSASLDCCVLKSQISSSFWNTQTSPSDTNHHARVKVMEIIFVLYSDVWFEHQLKLLYSTLLSHD